MNFVKKAQYYFHSMKMFIPVINAVMFTITNVGIKEISVPNVKELKNGLKFKNTLHWIKVKNSTKSCRNVFYLNYFLCRYYLIYTLIDTYIIYFNMIFCYNCIALHNNIF